MKTNIRFRLGAYKSKLDRAIQEATSKQVVSRLWAGDHRLWAPSAQEISNRLGWLDIAERMLPEISKLEEFVEDVRSDGIDKVLLLGMGGSSLAPEVFSKLFGNASGHPRLSVLDSTDPRAVRAKLDSYDPARTLYIVATKSGGTVETISFFKTFYQQALDKLGARAGQHFVAITDPGSKLEKLAQKYGFRETFLNDANIGGRFSALSYFGLVPAALLGMDLARLLKRATAMAKACRTEDIEQNPGALLGLLMGSLAQQGRDKLTFIAPAEIGAFGDWVEQLIAESTGKSGTGILPVLGNTWMDVDTFGSDRAVVEFTIGDESKPTQADPPTITIPWSDKYAIGGQFFLWEFATALAGHVLEIHPFNQPNVEAAKVLARQMMAAYEEQGELPLQSRAPLGEKGVTELLSKAQAGAYIAIQAYTQPSESAEEALAALKAALEKRSRLACSFGFGPRFLHSTGQLHKGDDGKGLFVQILDQAKAEDLPIPDDPGGQEAKLSYEVLKQAQAAGDAAALSEAGRQVLQTEVSGIFAETVLDLAREL